MKLLDLLFKVVNANIGPLKDTDDRFLWAEDIVTKFFHHATSILYLSRETQVSDFPSAPLKFIDPASITVLARAALESFLTFHYVFISPGTAKEKNCRYWAWRAAGLTTRQSFPIQHIEEYKQQLSEEKKKVDELYTKLNSNSVFLQLSKDQKKKILKGEWRLKSWPDIAQSAGLAKDLATNKCIYSYLSEYAHSGSLSAAQVKQASLNKEQLRLIQFKMNYIPIVIANFIRGYCQLFPRAKATLTADAEGRKMVKGLIKVGQELSFGDNKL